MSFQESGKNILYRCKLCSNICVKPNYCGRCDAHPLRYGWRRGFIQILLLGLGLVIAGLALPGTQLIMQISGLVLIFFCVVLPHIEPLFSWYVRKTIYPIEDADEQSKKRKRFLLEASREDYQPNWRRR